MSCWSLTIEYRELERVAWLGVQPAPPAAKRLQNLLGLRVAAGPDADLSGDVVAVAPRDTRLLQHIDHRQSFAARTRQREQARRRIGDDEDLEPVVQRRRRGRRRGE